MHALDDSNEWFFSKDDGDTQTILSCPDCEIRVVTCVKRYSGRAFVNKVVFVDSRHGSSSASHYIVDRFWDLPNKVRRVMTSTQARLFSDLSYSRDVDYGKDYNVFALDLEEAGSLNGELNFSEDAGLGFVNGVIEGRVGVRLPIGADNRDISAQEFVRINKTVFPRVTELRHGTFRVDRLVLLLSDNRGDDTHYGTHLAVSSDYFAQDGSHHWDLKPFDGFWVNVSGVYLDIVR